MDWMANLPFKFYPPILYTYYGYSFTSTFKKEINNVRSGIFRDPVLDRGINLALFGTKELSRDPSVSTTDAYTVQTVFLPGMKRSFCTFTNGKKIRFQGQATGRSPDDPLTNRTPSTSHFSFNPRSNN